ncbi:hypothetical protein RHECNPAF_221004 [Rhizobium etli CNPAF512]|nr:hypothetical protein RHECNPAF_221004 [Rhizobium etli CNPAF512]
MGMLLAEGLAGLKALAEALLENADHSGNACLVACAGLCVLQRHLFDLPAIPRNSVVFRGTRQGMRQVKAAVQLRMGEDFIPLLS